MCLISAMVWILSQYDNFHLVERAAVKCVEYELCRRVNRNIARIFISDKFCEVLEVFFLKFLLEHLFPTALYFYAHTVYIRGILSSLHSRRISSGQMLDCISPICAFLSKSIHSLDCPIPPPMLNGSVPSSMRRWKYSCLRSSLPDFSSW